MKKKVAITLDEQVYKRLRRAVGRRHMGRFVESLIRPYVMRGNLEAAYRQMAQDEAHEAEALEWAEATVGDGSRDPR